MEEQNIIQNNNKYNYFDAVSVFVLVFLLSFLTTFSLEFVDLTDRISYQKLDQQRINKEIKKDIKYSNAVTVNGNYLLPEVLGIFDEPITQWAFEETFDGDPTAPSQDLLPRTLDYTVTHRSHPARHFTEVYNTFPGDHGLDCTGPIPTRPYSEVSHQIQTSQTSNGDNPDESFYICKNHFMSAMGDVSGYSVSAFYPRQEFDFSEGGVLEFDVNINGPHIRSWWEILITPREQMRVAPAIEWLPIDEVYPKDRIVLEFGENLQRTIKAGTGAVDPDGWLVNEHDYFNYVLEDNNDPALNDRRIRRKMRVELDTDNNEIRWGIELEDGTFSWFSQRIPGGFPFNRGMVIFKTHAYTPSKDDNADEYTFHWDNLRFSGPVVGKYSSVEADDYVYLEANGAIPVGTTGSNTVTLPDTIENPALFAQIHNITRGMVLLSINGGPQKEINATDYKDNDCHSEGWKSVFVPLDASELRPGVNTFEWTVGEQDSCADGLGVVSGFSVKGMEIQLSGEAVVQPPTGGGGGGGEEPQDTTAPILSNLAPSGTLAAGTTSTTLIVSTNEGSTCEYSTDGSNFTQFMMTGNSVHESSINSLQDGNTYEYFVRCTDAASNISATLSTTFSVDTQDEPPAPVDTTPPAIISSSPSGTLPAGTTTVNINVQTNELATCRYDASPKAYANMLNNFNTTNGINHTKAILNLSNGNDYTFYVRCVDTSNNAALSDHIINFRVANEVVNPVVEVPTPAQNEFVGRFYNGLNFDELAFANLTSNIDYSWDAGSIDAAVNSDQFSVIWEGDFDFSGGTYEFRSVSNDGIRVYVDNNLIMNDWTDHAPTEIIEQIELSQGSHNIKVEYYENVGTSQILVDWTLLDTPTETDTTPPTVSNGSPIGVLGANTTQVDLVVNTNEDAVCRYDTIGNLAFNNMDNEFALTGTTEHNTVINGINSGNTYVYFVKCVDYSGNISPQDYVITFSTEENPVSSQVGSFRADYYDGRDLEESEFAYSEEGITEIDFDWGYGSPSRELGRNRYSIRYSGDFDFGLGGKYRFTSFSDDGIRVYVDGNLIIDDWNTHRLQENNADVVITSGIHEVVVEYFENRGRSSVYLDWENIDSPFNLNANVNEFVGTYYNNIDFTDIARVEVTDSINYNWGAGAPFPNMGADTFSVRYEGEIAVEETGQYQMTVSSNDGIRIYIDGAIVFEKWYDHAPETDTVILDAVEGVHTVVIEYYENVGTAEINVNFQQI